MAACYQRYTNIKSGLTQFSYALPHQ